MKTKPFDLEAAKAGAPVCTRNGRPARIICTDFRDKDYPIVALIAHSYGSESITLHTLDGHFYTDGREAYGDLVMPVNMRMGWVNIYKRGDDRYAGDVYSSKKEAEAAITEKDQHVATICVEWEE